MSLAKTWFRNHVCHQLDFWISLTYRLRRSYSWAWLAEQIAENSDL